MHTPHIVPAASTTSSIAAAERPAPHPPRPASPARPGAKPDEGNNLRILTYLQLHWLKIAFCGLFLGSGGAYAAWELLATKFESTALLHVSSVPTALANQNPNQARTDLTTYMKTQSALIKSDFVLNAALRDLKDCPTLKAQKEPIKYLEEELIITSQDGSEVIKVTFKSHEPTDAKRIVDAVQKAYMSEVIQKEVQEKQMFVKKVEDALLDMRRILDRNMDALDKSGKPAAPGIGVGMNVVPAGGIQGVPLPPVAPGGQAAQAGLAPDAVQQAAGMVAVPQPGFDLSRINPQILVQKVAQLQAAMEKLPLQINAEKRRKAQLREKLEVIKSMPVSPATFEAVDKDTDVVAQSFRTRQSKANYDFKLAAGDPNSPGVRECKQLYEAQEARLAQLRADRAKAIESEKRMTDVRQIILELENVGGSLQKLEEEFSTDKVLLQTAEKQLADIPFPLGKGMGMDPHEKGYNPELSKLEGTDGIYRSLVRQYYLTKMELDSPARVKLLQSASNPVQKDMKKQIIGAVFAGLMGFGLMALGVVAFETMAKRVSSLGDAKGASHVPVVGVIPCLPGEAVGKDPLKRAAASEAIDKLRAYVAQTWLARGATTVTVTSPLGEEGKAFTAFGLASSLAQSGYKTLIVDFDLRDPQLHAFTGVANQNGVCELLRAETDPRTAIQFLPSGLHLLPAGKWSDEARKAATGERLEALFAKLKGPYDCVVIHGHALLTAAESVEVARRCEVVLVCALYRETTMPLLKRAAERIAAMEIPYSGVVYLGASEQEALC